MSRQRIFSKLIPSGILMISLMWIYLATLAPGLTWANSGSDGGDLITATAIGGIAHPSGYPLYMLLARGFQSLPVGSLAYRTNLMSAFFATLTSVLVYALVVRHSPVETELYQAHIAGLSAGFATGLAPLLWSQAVITEVYTLHAFFVALILYLVIGDVDKPSVLSIGMHCLLGLIYGLAAGNHLTALLVIPVAIVVSCISRYPSTEKLSGVSRIGRRHGFNWKSAARQISWMFLGLLIYLVLPLRALTQPVVNWGNPVNLNNFWWLVSGQAYRFYYLPDSLFQLWPRLQMGAGLLLQQFGLFGVVLGFAGLVMTFKVSRLHILTVWNALAFWIVTLIYRSIDSYVYFIPVIVSFSVWIGLSVGYIAQYLSKWKKIYTWLFVTALLINLIFGLVSNWGVVDASHDDRAESFGKQVLTVAPENALVFAEGDQAIFALWYFHFALGQRPDVSVIASDLLHWEWYLESLRATYPSLDLTTPFPWLSTIIDANPVRPVCYASYIERMEISCNKK